ncbi:MAG: hypothetical protein ACFE0O_00890 [Opitutales bacterium]
MPALLPAPNTAEASGIGVSRHALKRARQRRSLKTLYLLKGLPARAGTPADAPHSNTHRPAGIPASAAPEGFGLAR